MGSQAVDKITTAYLKKSELAAKLTDENDPTEKKKIKEQIKVQEEVITTKSAEFQDRLENLESTSEGKIVVETLLEARQKLLNTKIEDNNSKKSKPQIKSVTITKLVEKNTQKPKEQDNKQDEKPEEIKNPKVILVSKLSKENKKAYDKVCEVIDNEPTLTPSYIESLKMKILKKLAK